MKKESNAILCTHVQQFIREVYADQLKRAGFFSYKGEDICWFRLVNNEVIHAVYFVASHGNLPAMLEIGYGCHPLFVPPVFSRSPLIRPKPSYEQMYNIIPEIIPGSMPNGVQRSLVHGLSNQIYSVPDIMVNCPVDADVCRTILQHVLDVLASINTPTACFEAHKRWRDAEIENGSWLTMTPFFVEEVLYWEEKSLYSYCEDYINGKLVWLDYVQQGGKFTRKAECEEYTRLLNLKEIFLNDARAALIQELNMRKEANLNLLQGCAVEID